jgi:branched-chain amino acid transport system substrate-binding protein
VVPAARVAEECGMLFVEPAAAAKQVFEHGFKNLFYARLRSRASTTTTSRSTCSRCPKGRGPRRRPMQRWNDPFAKGTAYVLKARLEAGGIKTLVDEVYPPSTTDFNSIAAKIAASKADIVVGGSQSQDGVNLIVALQQLNYQPKLAAFSTAPTEPSSPGRSATRPRASWLRPGTRRS